MSKPPAPHSTPSEGICTACGLCCTGVLFDYAQVEIDESDRLTGIGFALEAQETDEGLQKRFTQPCAMWKGGICSVYSDRPAVCRAFRCKLLRGVEDGSVTADEALERIATAKEMLGQVTEVIEDGETLPEARARWRREMTGARKAAQPTESHSGRSREFLLRFTLLNLFLDRHFLRKSQQKMMRIEDCD